MKTALTIAGSDSGGGAGIQADIKTMMANGVYAMSAITALTAQNTTGVQGIMEVAPEFLAQQIDSVFTDLPPDGVKVGMVSSAALIRVIAQKLRQYEAGNIVVDPVMVATSGARLISGDAVDALKEIEGERRLDITLTEDLCTYRFSVSNNGPMIPLMSQQSIFLAGVTTKSTGHGMGLYIARKVLQDRGGDMTLVSNAEKTEFSGFVPKDAIIEKHEATEQA